MNYSICCLQETFITDKTAKIWQLEWSGEFVYAPGTSNIKGLIILINRNIHCTNLHSFKINDRCMGISFSLDNTHFSFINMYVPSIKEQRVDFINSLPDLTQYCEADAHQFVMGDFNMTLNNNLDIINGLHHGQQEISCFKGFLAKYDLFDTWRNHHPILKEYSWIRTYRNTTPVSFVARRLDYILLNNKGKQSLKHVNMSHFTGTDHKAVIATLKLDSFPRGPPGLWKFEDSLLDNESFIDYMSLFITNHFNNLVLENLFSKSLIWDLLKIGIRDRCVAFVKNKKIAEWGDKLNDDIENLSCILSSDPTNINVIRELSTLTSKKEIRELAQARGAMKRSKARFIEFGEKPNKYFLNLESSRKTKQVIRELYNKDDILVNSPENILIEISDFYKTLMNEPIEDNVKGSEAFLNTFLTDVNHPTLNEEEKRLLDSPILIEQLHEALKRLNRDSSPGSDGLTPQFYLSFWNIIKQPLFDCFNDSIENKTLSISQRRAIITLLPKGQGDVIKHLKSWRPLSLTNTDYKIYSKILAQRLQQVLTKLIHTDQVGYIAGRSINDHIRMIDDIILTAKIENLPGLIISLDYQKAFDTVSKASILTTLKRFNFGEQFIRFVSTLINNTEASVKNANWHTAFFTTDRGVRQGCCLSPLLFILVVELLALKIRANNNIEGLLNDTSVELTNETKLLQYADDVSLFFKSKASLIEVLKEIESFKHFSGLTLNKTKSIGMWLGRNKENPDGGEGLKWLNSTENIKILGVYFNSNIEASLIKENWTSKLESIKTLIINWSKRSISIWGKTLVAKTFLLSKINYAIQSLSLPEEILTEIDNLIFKYLWKSDTNKNGYERINRSTLCLGIQNGGLAMISIKDQQEVMLLRWLHRIHSRYKDNHTHFKIINKLFKCVGGIKYCYFTNVTLTLFQGLSTIKSVFWKKAATSWLNYKQDALFEEIPVLFTPIFNNIDILHAKKPIFIKRWILSDFKYVHELFINGRIKSYEEIRLEIGAYPGLIFDYLAVRNAVTKVYNHTKFQNMNFISICVTSFSSLKNKDIRKMIIENKKHSPKCKQLWLNRLNIDVSSYFNTAHLATKEGRLRSLQFKITHSIYPTNILLNKMGVKPNNKCVTCNAVDTLFHFFFDCDALTELWKHVEIFLNLIMKTRVKLKAINALFGLLSDDVTSPVEALKEANHLILIAKLSISKVKYSNSSKNVIFIFEHEMMLRKKYFIILNQKVQNNQMN